MVGGLRDGFLCLGEAVSDDLALDRDEIDTVRRHLLRCATLALGTAQAAVEQLLAERTRAQLRQRTS